jgi:hypothetical protein
VKATSRTDLEALKRERSEIRAGMPWAYAMGHGCSMGFLPIESRAVLQRERDLAARIQELEAQD